MRVKKYLLIGFVASTCLLFYPVVQAEAAEIPAQATQLAEQKQAVIKEIERLQEEKVQIEKQAEEIQNAYIEKKGELENTQAEKEALEIVIAERQLVLEEQAKQIQTEVPDIEYQILVTAESPDIKQAKAESISRLIAANVESLNKQKADQEKLARLIDKINTQILELQAKQTELERLKKENEDAVQAQKDLLDDIKDQQLRLALQTQFNLTMNAELLAEAGANPDANKLIEIANTYLGVPYVWGGKTPAGFDCSGFVRYVYALAGYGDIGVWTVAQESAGVKIPVSEALPGDLLFWGPHGATYHVAMYTGNGHYIEAPQPGGVVQYSTLSYFMPDFALRIQ